jgi:hypothetical protein
MEEEGEDKAKEKIDWIEEEVDRHGAEGGIFKEGELSELEEGIWNNDTTHSSIKFPLVSSKVDG